MTLHWPSSEFLTVICGPSPDNFTLCLKVKAENLSSMSIGFLDANGSIYVYHRRVEAEMLNHVGLEVEESDQCTAHQVCSAVRAHQRKAEYCL